MGSIETDDLCDAFEIKIKGAKASERPASSCGKRLFRGWKRAPSLSDWSVECWCWYWRWGLRRDGLK